MKRRLKSITLVLINPLSARFLPASVNGKAAAAGAKPISVNRLAAQAGSRIFATDARHPGLAPERSEGGKTGSLRSARFPGCRESEGAARRLTLAAGSRARVAKITRLPYIVATVGST